MIFISSDFNSTISDITNVDKSIHIHVDQYDSSTCSNKFKAFYGFSTKLCYTDLGYDGIVVGHFVYLCNGSFSNLSHNLTSRCINVFFCCCLGRNHYDDVKFGFYTSLDCTGTPKYTTLVSTYKCSRVTKHFVLASCKYNEFPTFDPNRNIER